MIFAPTFLCQPHKPPLAPRKLAANGIEGNDRKHYKHCLKMINPRTLERQKLITERCPAECCGHLDIIDWKLVRNREF